MIEVAEDCSNLLVSQSIERLVLVLLHASNNAAKPRVLNTRVRLLGLYCAYLGKVNKLEVDIVFCNNSVRVAVVYKCHVGQIDSQVWNDRQ